MSSSGFRTELRNDGKVEASTVYPHIGTDYETIHYRYLPWHMRTLVEPDVPQQLVDLQLVQEAELLVAERVRVGERGGVVLEVAL